MEMIDWLQQWLTSDNSYVVYLLILFFGAECFDMILGTFVAKASPDVEFLSAKWKTGIVIKLVEFGLIVYMLPVFLIFKGAGLIAYTTMLLALIGSEIYSVLGHLKIVDDGKVGVIDILSAALDKFFKQDKKED